MISEKTVELNLTTELLNYLGGLTNQVHYVLAPSQQQEGKLGYDAAIHNSGGAIYIQYKRAYVNRSVWSWHINYTSSHDQHSKLLQLESGGGLVFYAFPYFNTPKDIATKRRRLLLQTFWFKPSGISIPPPTNE